MASPLSVELAGDSYNTTSRGDGPHDICSKHTNMPTITIDDKLYDVDTLSDEAKEQLQNLQFVDSELARLQAQIAVLQTARMAYAKALQAALPSVLERAQASETMKFN